MEERRSNNRNTYRQQTEKSFKEIDHWENIRTIADRARESGKSFVEFIVDMERPVFTNGDLGYYRLNTLIVVDERSSLRLNTSALGIINKFFHDHYEDILDAVAEVRRKNSRLDSQIAGRDLPRDRFHGLDKNQSPDDEHQPEQDDPEQQEDPDGDDDRGNQVDPPNDGAGRRRTRRSS